MALAAGSGHASPSRSDPAFLGVGPFGRAAKGCIAEGVAPGGAAAEAGMQPGDVALAIDGMVLDAKQPCDQLVAAITSHAPGDSVRIDIARARRHVVVTAVLTTRAEVLRNKVGDRIASTVATDFDDRRRQFDLAERSGRPAVIGFFLPQCARCGRVFEAVADGLKKRGRAATLRGVLPRFAHDTALDVRSGFGASVPLAIVDNDGFDQLSITDPDRVFFVVIDRAGVVRTIVPVGPESEDRDASIDEVLVAADQAERPRLAAAVAR